MKGCNVGRGTDFFDFINCEKIPSAKECSEKYSYITVGEDLKKFRKKYRIEIKKENRMAEECDANEKENDGQKD